MLINPENIIYAVKRLIGRKFDGNSVKKDIQTTVYKIIKADNGDAWIESKGKSIHYHKSLFTLQKMKETVEKYLGSEVKKAVITVPAILMIHKDRQQKMQVRLQV